MTTESRLDAGRRSELGCSHTCPEHIYSTLQVRQLVFAIFEDVHRIALLQRKADRQTIESLYHVGDTLQALASGSPLPVVPRQCESGGC
jgi:hypothetical protein